MALMITTHEKDRVLGNGHICLLRLASLHLWTRVWLGTRQYLLSMFCVVQAETPHGSNVLRSQRSQQKADIDNIVTNIMLAKDIASNDLGLLGLTDVGHAARENSISVVCSAVLGQKADESLRVCLAI
jgi:hypothetical protein